MPNATTLPLTRESIMVAHEIIKPDIHRTPLLSSTFLSKTLTPDAPLLFKAENFQKACLLFTRLLASLSSRCHDLDQGGAFKIRGACYSISQLTPEERSRGVCTHSSGPQFFTH